MLFIAVSDNQYNARFVVSALYLVSSNIYIYINIYCTFNIMWCKTLRRKLSLLTLVLVKS